MKGLVFFMVLQKGTSDGDVALAPEAVGDVLEGAVLTLAVEALVGGGRLQGAKVLDVGAYLQVVEVGLVDG